MRLKETAGNPSTHLIHNIAYICNPEKTSGGIYIGGNAGQDPESICRRMQRNKERWQHTGGTQGFHYVISFAPETQIDEALAAQIAEEFCQELLGGDYLYVTAVHNDKDHMHVHVTFDSVNRKTGRIYHSPKGDWEKRIQPILNDLCRKHGLPPLDYSRGRTAKGVDYGTWKSGKTWEEKKTYLRWNDLIRDDIDEAISQSETYEGFLQYLKTQEYYLRDGKYLSLRPKERKRAIRSYRLGPGYGKEEIQRRLDEKELLKDVDQRFQIYGDEEAMRKILSKKYRIFSAWKLPPMQRILYVRWHTACYYRRQDVAMLQRSRQDVIEIRKLAAALGYMVDRDIQRKDNLQEIRAQLEKEESAVLVQLSMRTAKVRRKTTGEEERTRIKEEIRRIRAGLRGIRRELRQIMEIETLFADHDGDSIQPYEEERSVEPEQIPSIELLNELEEREI